MNRCFKEKLTRGDLFVGTIITLPSAEIAEILCQSGFDWFFVDLEHSAMDIMDAQRILQAAGEIPCLVRVPSSREDWIKKALDIGAAGVIIPQVRTAEEAQQAVRFCKYPPEGSRSVGIARAQGYGGRFQEYVLSANSQTAVIIQIEHIDAVDNIAKIIEVSGIDCLFVGPYDLAASMGKMGLPNDPDVQKAIGQVKEYAQRKKIPLGIFGAAADAAGPYIQDGYTLVAVSTDTIMIAKEAKKITDLLK